MKSFTVCRSWLPQDERLYFWFTLKWCSFWNVKKYVNIIQAQFLHTFSHSFIYYSVKVWTFCSYCSAHEQVLKEKTLQNPSMLYLGSAVFGKSSHLSRTLKCLFRECLSTFHMFLRNSRHGKAQNRAGVQSNSRAVKKQQIYAHNSALAYS